MQLKRLGTLAAIAGLFLSSPVLANDVNKSISLSGGTATFDAIHTDNLAFADTFTFDVLGPVMADVSAITIRLSPFQDIDFSSATLNGTSLTLFSVFGGYLEGIISAPKPYVGPLVLQINGNSTAANGFHASYAGTLNVVSMVPEPGTYALLLAGLGAVGFMARRRS
jgi:hypothetical protein